MAITKTKSKSKGIRYKVKIRDIGGRWMKTRTWERLVDAKKEERELLATRDSGAYRQSKFTPIPFHEAANVWLGDIEQRELSVSYALRIKQYIKNHLTPYFGTKDIKELRPSNITALISWLKRKNLTSNTINSVIKGLKAMFNFHIEEENLFTNPVKKKALLKLNRVQKEPIVWTPAEAERFLAHADQKYSDKKRWVYLIYKIAFNTGMRFGEIMSLELDDFDFKNSRIRVNKSLCYKSRRVKTPKNGKTRYPPLSPSLASEARQYALRFGKRDSLFTDNKGQYFSNHTFRNCHYLKDVSEADVAKTKFHNIRRFFMRESLKKGVREAELRKIVGHGSREMIDLYMSQLEDMSEVARLVNF